MVSRIFGSEGFYTHISRMGNQLLVRGFDSDGKRLQQRITYQPRLYLESDNPEDATWKSITGKPLYEMRFDTMAQMKDFCKQYQDVDGMEIHGNDKHIPTFVFSQFPKSVPFDPRLINVLKFDIETAYENGYSEASDAANAIVSIAVSSNRIDKKIVFGYGDGESEDDFDFRWFRNESDMLEAFLTWWTTELGHPDVVTGWNSRFYDIPYLVNRMCRHGLPVAKLSPWGKVSERYIDVMGRKQLTFDIEGVESLDYMDLFKKFCAHTHGNQESYKLDHIAHVVLGKKKLSYEEHGSLENLCQDDYQKFLRYNARDVGLIDELDAELGLLNLVFTLAYTAGVNYSETLGTIAVWDAIIYRRLASENVAVPFRSSAVKTEYPGGYVKIPQCGAHDWIMSFDFASLYPNLIVQYNMSPETLMYDRFEHGVSPESIFEGNSTFVGSDVAIAANGAAFRKDVEGIIPKIIREFYENRVKTKTKQLDLEKQVEKLDRKANAKQVFSLEREIENLKTEQTMIKILMNSLYGAMGNKYFRYFNLDVAKAITLSGQLAVTWAERDLNKWMNGLFVPTGREETDRIIAIDTDSVYVNVSDFIAVWKPSDPVSFLNEAGKKFNAVLDKSMAELARVTSAYKQRLNMKREVIASRGIWIAKKRYILNVEDKEGVRYSTPKIKMMGIQAVQSSTPAVCREEFKKIFKIIIDTDEKTTQAAIAEFKKRFYSLPAHEVAFPRGVTDIDSWVDRRTGSYRKNDGCPIHVRAAILHNQLLKERGIAKTVPEIKNGDKLKFIYLKNRNPIGENVIGFTTFLPKEFELDSWIDYDTQFEKTYVKPLRDILDAVRWKVEPVSSLEEFFV